MVRWFRELRCRLSGHRWGASRTTYNEGAMFARCVMACERCGFEWLQLRYPPASPESAAGFNQQLELTARLGGQHGMLRVGLGIGEGWNRV